MRHHDKFNASLWYNVTFYEIEINLDEGTRFLIEINKNDFFLAKKENALLRKIKSD